MKKIKKSLVLIVSLTIIISTLTSCDFLNKESFDEKDIIGTWNIDDASATAKVLGIDLVDVMTTTFNFLEDEAQAKFDSLASDFLETVSGTMSFNDDNTYQLNFTGIDSEAGTWTMDEEEGDLSLTKTGDGELAEIYVLNSLTETMMIIDMPAQEIALDLNNDDTPETNVKLVIVVELSQQTKQ